MGRRWDNYHMVSGDGFERFWGEYLGSGERDVLIVQGGGFDPRMNQATGALLRLGGRGRRAVVVCLIGAVDEQPDMPYTASASSQNLANLRSLVGKAELREYEVESGVQLAQKLYSVCGDEKWTDIVVDVSALPRGIYFTVVAVLLEFCARNLGTELHLTAAHSPLTDSCIENIAIAERAEYLYGFSKSMFDVDSVRDLPTVWFPLLGPGKSTQLERIYQLIEPDEVCPVLPSPSLKVREADDILVSHQQFLFDQLRVEERSVIYAAEDNPFEVYCQVIDAAQRYYDSLGPLGGCRVAISTTSSKLFSLGGLLAAHDLHRAGRMTTSVAHVSSQSYRVSLNPPEELRGVKYSLFSLWVSGTPYNA